MTLFTFLVILAFACSSILGEHVTHKDSGNQNADLTINVVTEVRLGPKFDLVQASLLDVAVSKEGAPGPPGPPSRLEDAARIYQLVNDQVATLETMPHNTNFHGSGSYAGLPLASQLNATITIDKPQQRTETSIELKKSVYQKKSSSSLTDYI